MLISIYLQCKGGNWQHLHALLEVEAGEDVLYVGDHLYSDVLRSKRTLGWRTAMIVPELEEEIKVFQQQMPLEKRIAELRCLRDELSSFGDNLRSELNSATDDKEKELLMEKLDMVYHDDEKIKEVTSKMNYDYHMAFHPVWGQMFKAGYQVCYSRLIEKSHFNMFLFVLLFFDRILDSLSILQITPVSTQVKLLT